jgi:diguanylate cyclase (GGDEF)-like protein/PAS domain S-box-containing protein
MRNHAEANLLALIDSTEDMWGSVDLDFRMVVFNKNFERYIQSCFGVQVAVGMNPMEMLPPERAAAWPGLYQRALTDGPFRTEHTLLDGRVFEIAVHPVLMDGKAAGVSVYGRDITDRTRAETKLKDSEERYRATFEQAEIGIIHTSFEGKFLRCNHRFAEIVGYTQEELAGLAFQQITAVEDREESAYTFARLASGEVESVRIEKRYLRKSGRPVWTKLTASVQRDGEGRPLHHIAFVEDISQRKESEEYLAAMAHALEISEKRYRTAFQTCLDSLAISSIEDGRYIDVNQAFVETIEFERVEVLGKTALELGIWVDPHEREELVGILRKDSVCREFEARFRTKSGKIMRGLMSSALIELNGQQCLLALVRDVTAAKATEERIAATAEALRVSEQRYRTVFQTSQDGVTISRMSDGQYIDVNKSFLDFMGYQREEIIGRTSVEVGIWIDANDRQKLVDEIRQNSTVRDVNLRYKKKSGEILWSQTSSSVIEIEGVPCLLSVVRDLSEARAAAEKIESLAFYDPLTRLPNRELLLDRLRQALTASIYHNGRKCALLLVDLDNLKILNDTMGHPVGDLLLQEVARRLTAGVRETDLVARLGGDEFAVLLEDLGESSSHAAEHAKTVGEKLLAALARPSLLNGSESVSTCSIGITVFGDHREDANEILQQADIAIDQAKAAGRNTLRFFSPALQEAVSARAALENELRQAIRDRQFLLYYQPQVSRGVVVGTEALVRWKHPQRGIVAPAGFISLAEETGLILELGSWVLETACEQIAMWARKPETARLTVAVNISALQFRQPQFVQQVLATLKRTGADPRNLKLELTESMLLENIEEVIVKMTSLRSHEIGFSLDDFGTGYSSLAYLKRLPLDQLKIDRTFVRDLPADASSRAIAETIISLGKAMGMPVIAEGVETEEQRDFLAHLGCHSIQGFLISRPLPVIEFENLLAALNKITVSYAI